MLSENLARFVLPDDLKLLEIKKNNRGYLWVVEKVRQAFEVCPKCGGTTNVRAGRCKSKVRDESLRREPLVLEILKHRYLCKSCKKTFTEPVSLVWPRRRTTQRYRKDLAKDCHNYTDLARVQREHKVSSKLMYQVYYEQIETKLRERSGKPWPKYLGIDEHFFKRLGGFSQFVTVFTDLKKRERFELAEGKSSKTVMEQVLEIPGAEEVKVVCIDLSSGYRSLVRKLFPNALVVADKFHVLRLLNPSIMSEGKNFHGHRQELSTRRLLLMNRKRLDYFVQSDIDRYLKDKPALNEVYRYKEKLYELYRTTGFGRATKKLRLLIEEMKNSNHRAVKRLAKTLHRWRSEICLYFENRLTNAFTEATNNSGKLVQKRGYGYKSFRNYRLRFLSARIF